MHGKLDLSSIRELGALDNAYLFNCAVSVAVSLPDEDPISIRNRNEEKIKIADFFMSQDIDVDYKDNTESTLLISVIVAYMPSDWKVKFTNSLISKGCDIKKKNKYGKSALDLAIFTKEEEIIKILLKYNG